MRVAVNIHTVLYPTSRHSACIHTYCPCSRMATVYIPEPLGGGVPKVFYFLYL